MTRALFRKLAGLFGCTAMLCAPTAQSGTATILYCFSTYPISPGPYAGMTEVNGVLYGTTFEGGATDCRDGNDNPIGCGVVFSFDPKTSQEKTLHAFTNGADGALPYSRLFYANGMLYGTTSEGGGGKCYDGRNYGCGTVFSINPSTGVETVLYAFQNNSKDGTYPYAAPFVTESGELFGTTATGGMGGCGCGTVFKLDLATDAETIVHSFKNDGTDGLNPSHDWTHVLGKLYSTTYGGGRYGQGTIFSIDPKTGAETTVYSFGNGSDGQLPYAGMTKVDDMLYGTTFNGGAAGAGTLFSLDLTTGNETVLYSFHGRDNSNPTSDLIHWKGILYGTAASRTVFSFDPKKGIETVVSTVDLGNDPFENNRLLQMNGTLYGTSPQAESCGFQGSIYSITP